MLFFYGEETGMNRARIHRLLRLAQARLSSDQPIEEVQKLLVRSMQEIGDPFASQIDEYLKEKTPKDDSPQEDLEEKQSEEGLPDQPETKGDEESPQDDLKDKLAEEGVPDRTQQSDDSPQEDLQDKHNVETSEDQVVSMLRKIADEVARRQYPILAQQLRLKAAPKEEVVALLNGLLLKEYQQRDMYESYHYLLFGTASSPLQEHLKEHMQQEESHIEVLQRYIVGYGSTPTLQRLEIPRVEPATVDGILHQDLALEHEAVQAYTKAILVLESDSDYTSLRVDLENILVQEQEHVHDLEQWLKKN